MSFNYSAPRDVFPRRNLGAGEEWGREFEKRLVKTENALAMLSLLLKGDNRTSASSLASLGRQLTEIENLALAIPQVNQSSASAGGFGLSGGWQTLVSDTIAVPPGMTTANVSTFGVLWMRASMSAGTLIQAKSRVLISGNAGPEFNTSADAYDPGLGATNAPQHGRNFSVTPGGTFTVALQVNPASAPAFPPDGQNYATITTMASFTG